VNRGPKIAKKNQKETEEKQPSIIIDPLAENIDWGKPMDEEMPHLHPYKRDDSNLQSVKDAIVKKYTEEQTTEKKIHK